MRMRAANPFLCGSMMRYVRNALHSTFVAERPPPPPPPPEQDTSLRETKERLESIHVLSVEQTWDEAAEETAARTATPTSTEAAASCDEDAASTSAAAWHENEVFVEREVKPLLYSNDRRSRRIRKRRQILQLMAPQVHRGSTAVVDLQGYTLDKRFNIKVLTVIRQSKDNDDPDRLIQTFIFRPPRPFHTLSSDDKKHVEWIKQYHPATPPWSSGSYNYDDRASVIRSALKGATTLYVKGGEKKRWLEEYMEGEGCCVLDLAEFGCPPLHECLHAVRDIYACGDVSLAGRHVIALYEWLRTYCGRWADI